jgi:hypothetical protein
MNANLTFNNRIKERESVLNEHTKHKVSNRKKSSYIKALVKHKVNIEETKKVFNHRAISSESNLKKII